MLAWLVNTGRRVWVSPTLLTIFGTLGCLFLSLALQFVVFGGSEEGAFWRGMALAIVLPLLIAPPLFLAVGRKVRELSSLHEEHARAIAQDSLTSCLNSTLFSAVVDAHPVLTGSRKGRRRGAFLVIDVDQLASLNTSAGHRAGDRALRVVAEIIRTSVRSDDLVGRLGGKEFGVFLPGATRENAQGVAERIRRAVSEASYKPRGADWSLSVSVGAVSFEHEIDYDDLVRAAEQTLQRAKKGGRNRVEYTQLKPGPSPSRPSLH